MKPETIHYSAPITAEDSPMPNIFTDSRFAPLIQTLQENGVLNEDGKHLKPVSMLMHREGADWKVFITWLNKSRKK